MKLKHRLRAAGIHLLSSLAVALVAASLVLTVWYPWPYRVVSGGQSLLLILMTVDIVIGPLLTLAVFNTGKPARELRRDLAVIIALQLAALSYGLYTVYQARPVVLALEVDRFRVTSAIDVVKSELPQALQEFRSLSLTGPRLVTTATPNREQRLDAIVLGLGGADLGSRPSFWRPWDDAARKQVVKAGRPLAVWLEQHPSAEGVVEAIEKTGLPATRLLYLPLLARQADWSVLVDKETGTVVGFAPIDV